MLLMERMPTLSSLARIQSGLAPIRTFSIRRAEKNGHSRGANALAQLIVLVRLDALVKAAHAQEIVAAHDQVTRRHMRDVARFQLFLIGMPGPSNPA